MFRMDWVKQTSRAVDNFLSASKNHTARCACFFYVIRFFLSWRQRYGESVLLLWNNLLNCRSRMMLCYYELRIFAYTNKIE